MAKMTKAQAEKLLTKEVAEPSDKAWERIAKTTPKVKQLTAKLDAEISKGESREMIDMYNKALRLQVQTLAEDVAVLHAGLKRLGELTDDPDFITAFGADDLTRGVKEATDRLEGGRNAVRDAKTALDRGVAFLKNLRVDADAAGEDWATAVTNLDRLITGVEKESPDWQTYRKNALAAVESRDVAGLEKCRKAKPASKNMDFVLGLDPKEPWSKYDKAYTVSELPDSLRKEIEGDRKRLADPYKKAYALSLEKQAIEAEVAELKVEPRDGEKALKTLEIFPRGALAKLQAAIDGPDEGVAKALEVLAKNLKLKDPPSGKEMVASLKKAKVI